MKKVNLLRTIMIMLVFGILLFGCVTPPPETNETVEPPIITAPNETVEPVEPIEPAEPYVLPEDYVLQQGDYASVIYALWVDDELQDTNNATLANESGIYNPSRRYMPLNFIVEFDSGMINGFILNILGMRVNETLTFNVKPELGYGLHDPSKVAVVPRYYNKSLFETVPRSYFEDRGLEVSNGTSYNTPYGMVFIDSYTDENVTIFYMLQTGQSFDVGGIPQTVVGMGNLTAAIEFDLELDKNYYLPDPETGVPTMFTVTEKTDQNITIDANHPLANKTLTFSVTLLDAMPAGAR